MRSTLCARIGLRVRRSRSPRYDLGCRKRRKKNRTSPWDRGKVQYFCPLWIFRQRRWRRTGFRPLFVGLDRGLGSRPRGHGRGWRRRCGGSDRLRRSPAPGTRVLWDRADERAPLAHSEPQDQRQHGKRGNPLGTLNPWARDSIARRAVTRINRYWLGSLLTQIKSAVDGLVNEAERGRAEKYILSI